MKTAKQKRKKIKEMKAKLLAARKELRQYYEEVKKELAKTTFSAKVKRRITEFLCEEKAIELKNTITGTDPEQKKADLAAIKAAVCKIPKKDETREAVAGV